MRGPTRDNGRWDIDHEGGETCYKPSTPRLGITRRDGHGQLMAIMGLPLTHSFDYWLTL